MRQTIEQLRLSGEPVCGTPATGYFMANSAEELDATIDFLCGRAKKSLLLAARLRGCSMTALLGQSKIFANPQEESQ